MNVGINLYSLHTKIQSEAALIETANRLKEMGYAYLQYSGAPFETGRLRRVIAETGLPVVLTHVPMTRILEDTRALIAEHREIGCQNIGLGMMPLACFEDETRLKETIERLERAAETMAAADCRLFYHHHHFEFARLFGGTTVFDYMLAQTTHLNFTPDTYWLQYGGVDIARYIQKCKGRVECIHLKDYAVTRDENGSFKPVFAPVGSGNIDFPALFDEMRKAGVKYYLVEQDDACQKAEPFSEVEKSVRYLKQF
ncbi:MAG: sugar phosphate isomerase/epimerase [Clostridiales bacterium]|jgi:sugar phosphate isomerase/epimerase|nr:sugar phosphate isomerase/epimerase [Clostridiales bacterium]